MPKYTWEWKSDDNSDRKVEITTFQNKESAREKAVAYFPDDPKAREYILNTDPIIS